MLLFTHLSTQLPAVVLVEELVPVLVEELQGLHLV